MDNAYHLIEYDDQTALEDANQALKKGWSLIHVGTKSEDTPSDSGQEIYINSYIFGLDKEQYKQFLEEEKYKQENDPFNDLLD